MIDQKLTHWKKLHNPDYLGSYAFDPEEEKIATVQSVGLEMVVGPDGKKEECIVARFREPDIKPMILNATNCKIISKMYGTPHIEKWTGRRVQIFVEQVRAFGELVDALRIRPKEPQVALPELTPGHEKWPGAVASLRDGKIDLAGIRKHFKVSDATAALLTKAAHDAQA